MKGYILSSVVLWYNSTAMFTLLLWNEINIMICLTCQLQLANVNLYWKVSTSTVVHRPSKKALKKPMYMIAKTESVWSLFLRAGSLKNKYSSRGLLEAVYQKYSESSHIHKASTRLSQRCTYSSLDWLCLNYSIFHWVTQIPLYLYCGHLTTTGCIDSPASTSCLFGS